MNRILFEHYPASKLPDEMRAKIESDATVTVVVMVEETPPEHIMTLEEIFAARRPPFRTVQEIDDDLRRDRARGMTEG